MIIRVLLILIPNKLPCELGPIGFNENLIFSNCFIALSRLGACLMRKLGPNAAPIMPPSAAKATVIIAVVRLFKCRILLTTKANVPNIAPTATPLNTLASQYPVGSTFMTGLFAQ